MAISHQEKMQRVQSALRMEAANNSEGAVRLYQELIKLDPADAALHYHHSHAQLGMLKFENALRAIREAIRLKPTVPEFLALQAIIHRASNRLDDALRAARRGYELDPQNVSIVEVLGDIYNIRGDIEEGIALMKPLYEAGCRHPQFLVVLAQLYTSANRREDARVVLEQAVAIPGLAGQPAAWAHLHLGATAEKMGDYEEAWRQYELGNRHRGTVFNPDQHDAGIADTKQVWTAERLSRLPRAKNRKADQMVFILGMPRSGTSLVEQILASHPGVYGGGELNFIGNAARDLLKPTLERPTVLDQLDALRQPVIDRESQKTQKLMTAPAPRAKRFTDKLPQNFLHIGMIELLFPEARIIQCLRDPRDVCLSCYTKLFGGANSQPFSGDLTHLGRYYRAYESIMGHWRGVSGLPIFQAVYEEGVQDLETYARRLIEFIGLEWDDACLRFWETKRDVVTASTDQVRRPIYTSSIGRWRHFERQLGPLFESLRMPPEAPWPR